MPTATASGISWKTARANLRRRAESGEASAAADVEPASLDVESAGEGDEEEGFLDVLVQRSVVELAGEVGGAPVKTEKIF